MIVKCSPDMTTLLEIRGTDMEEFDEKTGFGTFKPNTRITFKKFHLSRGANTLVTYDDNVSFTYPCSYEGSAIVVEIEKGVTTKEDFAGRYMFVSMIEQAKVSGGQFEVNDTDHFRAFEYLCANTYSLDRLTKLNIKEKFRVTEVVVARDFNGDNPRFHVCLPAFMDVFKTISGEHIC